MKRKIALFLAIALIMSVLTPSTAYVAPAGDVSILFTVGSTTYTVNGENRTLAEAPFICSDYGRAWIPLRETVEAVGGSLILHWQETSSPASIIIGNTTTRIYMDADLPGIPATMVQPRDVGGQLFVPSFFVEQLGFSGSWDTVNQSIFLNFRGIVENPELTNLSIWASPTVLPGTSAFISVNTEDQVGNPIAIDPTDIVWTVNSPHESARDITLTGGGGSWFGFSLPIANVGPHRTITLTARIGDVVSETVTITVDPNMPTLRMGNQPAMLWAGEAGRATFELTTTHVPNGVYEAIVSGVPDGISIVNGTLQQRWWSDWQQMYSSNYVVNISITNNRGTLTLEANNTTVPLRVGIGVEFDVNRNPENPFWIWDNADLRIANRDEPIVMVTQVGTLTAGTAGTANFSIRTYNIPQGRHWANMWWGTIPTGITVDGWEAWRNSYGDYVGHVGHINIAANGTGSLTIRGNNAIVTGDSFPTFNLQLGWTEVAPDEFEPVWTDPEPFRLTINPRPGDPPNNNNQGGGSGGGGGGGTSRPSRTPRPPSTPREPRQIAQPPTPPTQQHTIPGHTLTLPSTLQPIPTPDWATYLDITGQPIALTTITITADDMPNGTFAISIQGLPAGIYAPGYVEVINGEFDIQLLLTTLAQAGIYDLIFTLYNEDGDEIFTSGTLTLTVYPEPAAPPAPDLVTVPISVPTPPTVIRLAIGDVMFSVNGVPAQGDTAPFIDPESDRTMIPIRLISEILGAQVEWNHYARTAIIISANQVITLPVDEPLPGGMGTPVIVNDRTFVPARFIVEALGANIRWDDTARAVYIQQ